MASEMVVDKAPRGSVRLFTYLWALNEWVFFFFFLPFLHGKLVSVGPQIPVDPRSMAYYAYW